MSDLLSLARAAQAAVPHLAQASPAQRDRVLLHAAAALTRVTSTLLDANAADVERARAAELSEPFIDRLRLSEERIAAMAGALREVAALPGPLGRLEDVSERPNGLRVGRMRIPLGVIAIIYEARPNVTSDATGLCLKTGNAVMLKGGSHARHSNQAITDVLRHSLAQCDLPPSAVTLLGTDREQLVELLKLDEQIDLVIPRGGEGLIRFVAEHSRIPVLKHYKGVCHVYLDEAADESMAVAIVENAKVQRPSVCNAMETLLVHAAIAPTLLEPVAQRLVELGVTLHGCERTRAYLEGSGLSVEPATDDDYHAEYLSLDLAVRVVDDMDQAIEHIRAFGSSHTEAIVTNDYRQAMAFVSRVDSAVVLINASTRFADGGELGLGAEIGISTTKIHAFGPMGLEELTSRKFVVFGDGQVRP
jgi:glutamate-5-semialdehyde dehydrogenase